MTSRTEIAANYIILTLFALVALWPIGTIVVGAFGAPSGVSTGGLHWENFAEAWTGGRFGQYLVNSLSVSALVLVIAVPLSLLAGYAFGTMRFRGSTVLFYLFLLGIMVPAEAIVVPLFFDLQPLGLTDTIWAVALPQAAQSIAFGTYWMRTYFRSSSRAITEAARLDGASNGRILWQIHVPMARPALVTLIVLVFMWTWNEFLIPLVMSPTGAWRTMPLGLNFFQSQHSTEISLMAAGAVIVALPVVILYLFLQRHFIRGMVEGAVK
ncbi:carbohydrate ABC transporter permease [Galactobacter sp.]|uniref:carbohydrate ABC transporter permease n=1 Tax=Galactobacter sp. TaxID=2676125 RepID=UPI0025C41314|nr:carbohydrate ABC transporter permease [Galactobacter sp.]